MLTAAFQILYGLGKIISRISPSWETTTHAVVSTKGIRSGKKRLTLAVRGVFGVDPTSASAARSWTASSKGAVRVRSWASLVSTISCAGRHHPAEGTSQLLLCQRSVT